MASSNGDAPYRLDFSAAIAASIRRLQLEASLEGRGEEFLLAIRKVIKRLQRDPNTLGEAAYRLPALRMQIRTAIVRPVFVSFGICEDRPLVIIKAVKLLAPWNQ